MTHFLDSVLGLQINTDDNEPADELPIYNNFQLLLTALGVSALTQAQINALTAAQKPDGRAVWNSTARSFQIWDNTNGVWITVPLGGTYREILTGFASYGTAVIAPGAAYMVAGGGQPSTGGNPGTTPPVGMFLRAADFGPGSVLNIRASIIVAGTAPGQNIIFDLRPVSISSTTSVGAAVAGSTATIATPAINTITDVTSGDFTIPADGYYALCVRAAATSTSGQYALTSQLRCKP